MKKKSIIYSDLSRKQLEKLKEFYIQKKVESMSHQELKICTRNYFSSNLRYY